MKESHGGSTGFWRVPQDGHSSPHLRGPRSLSVHLGNCIGHGKTGKQSGWFGGVRGESSASGLEAQVYGSLGATLKVDFPTDFSPGARLTYCAEDGPLALVPFRHVDFPHRATKMEMPIKFWSQAPQLLTRIRIREK